MWIWNAIGVANFSSRDEGFMYDAVSDLMHNWVPQRPDFKSGKNVSKHSMLSISMAYNVISCKKVERNTQKLKIADFTM